jgi:hypothetical protein
MIILGILFGLVLGAFAEWRRGKLGSGSGSKRVEGRGEL